ncbi:MAG: YcnI family protein [Gaiella sp.]|nr:YcnI family protein [Gaiella sp.]
MSPPFVDADATTRVAFETPNERPPHATIAVEVTAPPGVELESAPPPPGWRLELTPETARWTGGRIEGRAVVSFPLAVTARTRAGTEVFSAVQEYDDGESVRWEAGLTVLPAAANEAPSQHLGRALAAGVVGLVVIVGSFLGLRLLRRRPLQEK